MYKLCCSRPNPLKLIRLLLYNLTLLDISCHICNIICRHCDSESMWVKKDKDVLEQHIYFWYSKLVLTTSWKLISNTERLLSQRLNVNLIDHSMFSWKVKIYPVLHFNCRRNFRQHCVLFKLELIQESMSNIEANYRLCERRHLQGFTLRGSSEEASHGDRLFHQAHTGKLCVINSLWKKKNKWTVWTVQLKEDAYGVFIFYANHGESHEKLLLVYLKIHLHKSISAGSCCFRYAYFMFFF